MKQELIGLSQQNVTVLRKHLVAFGQERKDALKESGNTTLDCP
jgi:hypothetical protein